MSEKVAKVLPNNNDFKDKIDIAQEYEYNENGHVIADKNKGISSITYTMLGRPGENAQMAAASSAGGMVGAWAGAEAGAVIGAGIGVWFGGVGAVPGAVIGGFIGGIAGSLTGSYVGESAVNYYNGR